MKKIVVLLLLCIATEGVAQAPNKLFGKNPIINLENFQKQRVHFGFFLGFNAYDFKIDYKTVSEDIQVKTTTGFNVGLVANLRLQEYIDLRFEPGWYYTQRILQYPKSYFPATPIPTSSDLLREVNSTYLHFPLLLKFSSQRTGNIRPYLVGGVSATLNLSSNAKSIDDNYEDRFRVKSWTTNYELGFGIDIFSEYFIFSPSIRGVFGLNDELIRDNNPDSPWTSNIESLKSRAVFINFTFH
jgi:Outer membrane protein beta-barrel domain